MFIASHARLATYTSYRIGGTCARMLFPETAEDFSALQSMAGERPVLVMGNGSNMLFAERYFDAVIVNLIRWQGVSYDQDAHTVTARSGSSNGELLALVKTHQIAHYEFLAGIPGTIGGAVAMNAGAWGTSIGPLVKAVTIYSLTTHRLHTLKADQMNFIYRGQTFLKPGEILVSITLSAMDHDPQIGEKITDILNLRHEKHPSEPSCGSFFKNFPDISAGSLLESCGLSGRSHGDAQISPKHANFIINRGEASFSDILTLSNLAGTIVKERYQLQLEPEVKIVESIHHPLFFHPAVHL